MKKAFVLAVGVVALGAGLLLIKAPDSRSIRVGYVACLSGRSGELGREGLKGVQFAVEEFNRAGGIDGRRVELRVADNHARPESAWTAVEELLAADVEVIIGHMTSEMSASTLQKIEAAGVVMLSPTTATRSLSGKDDHFLRIYPDVDQSGRKMAEYAHTFLGLKRLAVLYDRSNYAFGHDVAEAFRTSLAELGSELVATVPFNSAAMEMSYLQLIEQVASSGAEGVLIVANPSDTALLCQQVAKKALPLRLMATEWSHSPRLHQLAGGSIDNLVMFQTVMEDDPSPEYQTFVTRFSERFGEPPWFASVHAFDATRLALEALVRNSDPARLKETLLGFGTFHGVQSLVTFDRFGDAERTHYVEKVSAHRARLVAML